MQRNPFLDPAAATLATVIVRLEACVPDRRRRGEMASGIRTFCRVVGHTPGELPADMALLGRLSRKAQPAAAEVSPARWANVKSLTLDALRHSGLSLMPGRRLHPLSPAWAELDARLPDRYQRAQLSRVMRWCSAEGIMPSAVDAASLARFRAALLDESLIANPRGTWLQTVCVWNKAVATVPGWPAARIDPPPPARARYALPLTAFPDKFQRDAQAWLDRLAGKAGLEEGPLRPVRGATLAKWRFAIRQMASALVQAGRNPASITGLADLVSLEAAATILTFFHERANGIPTTQTGSIAANLKAIARHHAGAPEAVLAKLRRMAAKVTPRPQGMTAKNRAMLRQFMSETQQRQLLTLPGRLFAKLLAREPLKVRDAMRLQTAMAVALLLAVPMRLGNLCRLEPGRHLQVLGRGRHERWFVIIPGEEVKNGEPIELPLPERTLALLRLYRERVLPVLAPAGSTYLFPGKSGHKAEVSLGKSGHKAEVSLGGQIPRFLQRELGYRLSAHQFRHLVGFVYLQQRPDGHEVVRRMLGHRDIRTTIAFYAGMETIAAAGHYEAVVAELLAQPAATRRAGARLRRYGPDGALGVRP